LAVATTAATFALILAGGIVTTTGAGLAVPDWPTTFGYDMFSFPWAKMTGGILYEHSHRLIGSLVGLLTLSLAILLWVADRRRWVAWLGAAALAAVVVQGILGGLRVVLLANHLAFVHGVVAHGFLALVASLALFTSRAWNDQAKSLPTEVAARLRGLCLFATVGIFVQIILGAIVTHTGRRVDAHIGLAVVLSVLVPLLTQRMFVRLEDRPHLTRPASHLRAAWIVQLILGLGSYVARFHGLEVPMAPVLALALPVAHRLAAGWMLIAALLLALQVFRLSRSVRSAIAGDDITGKAAA
jgi:cytochrome c oxidase assembly protein subunit 15